MKTLITRYKDFLYESSYTTPSDPEFYHIEKYEVIDGIMNCFEDVSLSDSHIHMIPFKFGRINGKFSCSKNLQLSSLENCPFYVRDNFYCSYTNITNLDHCPKYVGRDFHMEGLSCINNLDDYPVCIIKGELYGIPAPQKYFNRVCEIIKNNEDLFTPLLDNKLAFHQQVMRIDPSFIEFYHNISPPSTRTII